MQELLSGQNIVLYRKQMTINVQYSLQSNFSGDIDSSAFLLSKAEKIQRDEDFVFYNQPSTPEGSVKLSQGQTAVQYQFDLSLVPDSVDKIALTIVIDGQSTISGFGHLNVTLDNEINYAVPLGERSERSLILGHVYRHQGAWKFKALGIGFNGGLKPLAQLFGVEVADDAPASEPATKNTVSLEKKIQEKAPHLVSLVKSVKVNLEKHRLSDVKAKVAFVLDGSGSMTAQFKKGNVQAVLERIAILAAQFDDDGSMDVWGFAAKHQKYEDVTLDNLQGYIKRIQDAGGSGWLRDLLPGLGGTNNEPPVMQEVVDTFKSSKDPVFVVFITDGGISETRRIKQVIKESANYPIFWKFVGLGGRNYGILEQLDDFTDRLLDNTDFFPIDDFQSVPDNELYDRLLVEFSDWLKKAKQHSLL